MSSKEVLKLLRERRQLAADLKLAPAASSRVIAAAIAEIDAELERRSREVEVDLSPEKSKK